jgi:hypothetical protein
MTSVVLVIMLNVVEKVESTWTRPDAVVTASTVDDTVFVTTSEVKVTVVVDDVTVFVVVTGSVVRELYAVQKEYPLLLVMIEMIETTLAEEQKPGTLSPPCGSRA